MAGHFASFQVRFQWVGLIPTNTHAQIRLCFVWENGVLEYISVMLVFVWFLR